MNQYIVILAKLLQLIGIYDQLALYALTSFPCENKFSETRSMCKSNNDIDMTTTALKRMKILEIVELQI